MVVWQETRDYPDRILPDYKKKGIKMTIHPVKNYLNVESGEVRWIAQIHEEGKDYCGHITLDINDNGNLVGWIGYYDRNGHHWTDGVSLDWNSKYIFYLIRTRDPHGDIYLNMYIMDENGNILASESVLVNYESNHPYIMVELQGERPYDSAFEYVDIGPIDVYTTDNGVIRWKYSDGSDPWENSEEKTDELITINSLNNNGDMLFRVKVNR